MLSRLCLVGGLLLLQTVYIDSFRATSGVVSSCQGKPLRSNECPVVDGIQTHIIIRSVTLLTNANESRILDVSSRSVGGCAAAEQCRRTIHNSTDQGITDRQKHLYDWIVSSCQGRTVCENSGNVPEHWDLVEPASSGCGEGEGEMQFLAGLLIDQECWATPNISTLPPPPGTTPRTRPTTPTTTTPFPAFIHIYQPELIGPEKVILGVAIGLAIIILLVLLIVLYCCERYRNSKKLGKLMRMLGAPQAQDDVFDELDYGKNDAWRDETQNEDALGEYTGVKPDEFLTLDKRTMESTGQIMYDAPMGTMHKGNSCSTLDRLDRQPRGGHSMMPLTKHTGPVDYETAENLELERRMRGEFDYEEAST